MFLVSSALATPQDVRYSGFACVGKFADIPTNFKYTSQIINSTKDKDGRSIFDKESLRFFQGHKSSLNNFNLLLSGESSDTKISMALALTRENVSVVNIDNVYKIVVNLGVNVVFMNFENMNITATYPLYLEYVHVMQEPPKDEDILTLLNKLYFSDDFSIFKLLEERLGNFKLKNDARLTFKIMKVDVKDEAMEKLGSYKDKIDALESISAQKFSDFLSSRLKVSVLPYAKDYLGAKMALSFSDGRMIEFIIPPASYGVDFILRKLTKEIYKEGIGEDAYLFGVYTTVKVYDPDLGTNYWEKKVKYGAVKNIPKLQKSTDDFAIHDEMTGLVMLEAIKEMQKDKTFYKEVVERCINK